MFNQNNGFNNFGDFMSRFEQFKQNFNNSNMGDPQQVVQQLLNSGQMTQQQFNQLREIANMLTGRKM